MSKVSNAILMLRFLANHKKYTIKELAEKLEVSERMVRSYKDDLEKAGVFIESIKGKNGGYILYDNVLLPKLQVSKYDAEVLGSLKEKIKDDPILSSSLSTLIDKVKFNEIYNVELKESFEFDINNSDYLNVISECCNKKEKLAIYYASLSGDVKKRIIHPFGILLYKADNWVIAAFCELRGEIRLFNLNRIKKIERLGNQNDN